MNHSAQTESRRLLILTLLQEDTDYSINDSLLQELIKAQGHGVSLDKVRSDLAWLEEQEVLTVRQLPSCWVAVLRQRGLDVMQGVAQVPGIARPRPQ